MGFLRRRRDGAFAQHGRWERPVHDQVVSLVILVAESHGFACRVLDDNGLRLSRGDEEFELGLTNLRQRLAGERPDDWPAVVADFVGAVIVGFENRLETDDFQLIRPLVRTRFYGADPQIRDQFCTIEPAPGLVEVVVIDRPTSVMLAPAADVAAWRVPQQELFRLGRGNVRADPPLDREEHDVDGVRVCVLSGESFYATTHLHWLGDYLVLGPFGAFLALPNRHVMLAHAVWDGSAIQALGTLRRLAERFHTEGPGSITADVYWWRAGRLSLVQTVIGADGRARIQPSAELGTMLDQLARSFPHG
jgi:hypothetical protein